MTSIAVIGLGYVGLPLALQFAHKYPTLGFDIDAERVRQLQAGRDRTLEADDTDLRNTRVHLTADPSALAEATVFVVTVPTPIDESKRPDLRPLMAASELVAQALKPGDTVIYESTVYPGATEEQCVPVLEATSGLTLNDDFTVGYSPERINPGDPDRKVTDIVKVTSGSTPEAASFIDNLYASIIPAGTHRAPSIKVAEAAKVVENTQRDVNIALINELALLFHKLGLNTQDVLAAAGTKWNFMPFRPGLVGGHCTGVDPYYLTHKAQEVGHHPEVILAGRRINDNMGRYVADRTVLLMAQRGLPITGSRALILGLAFKGNCPDVRNTRVIDIVRQLESYGVSVDVADPWVDPEQAKRELGIGLVEPAPAGEYAAVVVAVDHRQFVEEDFDVRSLTHGVVYDVTGRSKDADESL